MECLLNQRFSAARIIIYNVSINIPCVILLMMWRRILKIYENETTISNIIQLLGHAIMGRMNWWSLNDGIVTWVEFLNNFSRKFVCMCVCVSEHLNRVEVEFYRFNHQSTFVPSSEMISHVKWLKNVRKVTQAEISDPLDVPNMSDSTDYCL